MSRALRWRARNVTGILPRVTHSIVIHSTLVVAMSAPGCSRVADLSPDPYDLVAESAFRSRAVASPCESDVTDAWSVFGDVRLAPRLIVFPPEDAGPAADGVGVGQLARRYAASGEGVRFQKPGLTVLDQLAALTEGALDAARRRAVEARDSGDLSTLRDHPAIEALDNPIASFLLNHLTALALASESLVTDPTDPSWTVALTCEVAALGYLLDAMSADRMNTPQARGPFFALSRNRDVSARTFGDEGVFVLNADGEVWHSFGRAHLEWFRTHLCHVMDAAQRAVRELFFAHHVANDHSLPAHLQAIVDADPHDRDARGILDAWLELREGSEWLEHERLPSLRALPSPVWATWRLKGGPPDSDGVRAARHVAQIESAGSYDPTIFSTSAPFGDADGVWHPTLDRAALRRPGSVPSWRRPRTVLGDDPPPALRAREDRDLASVRFVHRRRVPPSLAGLFVAGSVSLPLEDEDGGEAVLLSPGLGLLARERVMGFALWAGVRTDYRVEADDGERAVTTNMVFSVSSNPFRPGMWVEIGALWDVVTPIRHGWNARLAWLPATLSLGVRYAGVSPLLEVGMVRSRDTIWRAGAGLVLH